MAIIRSQTGFEPRLLLRISLAIETSTAHQEHADSVSPPEILDILGTGAGRHPSTTNRTSSKACRKTINATAVALNKYPLGGNLLSTKEN